MFPQSSPSFEQSIHGLSDTLEDVSEHRDDIWKCVRMMVDSPNLHKHLSPMFFHGELQIKDEYHTVDDLVACVRESAMNGWKNFGGESREELLGLPFAAPLSQISVANIEGGLQIIFSFQNPMRETSRLEVIFIIRDGSIVKEECFIQPSTVTAVFS